MNNLYHLVECFRSKLSEDLAKELSSATIENCAFYENEDYSLVALVCSGNQIYCYFTNAELAEQLDSGCDSLNGIVKQLKWNHQTHRTVAICVDRLGFWLLALSSDGIIRTFAVHALKNSTDSSPAEPTNVIKTNCERPTAVTWYTSYDNALNIIIIGNAKGRISFLDIREEKEICSNQVTSGVTAFEIIRDESSSTLLITCNDNSQWILELEHYDESLHSASPETPGSPLESFRGWFIVRRDVKLQEQRERAWTSPPVSCDMFTNNNSAEVADGLQRFFFQSPFILKSVKSTGHVIYDSELREQEHLFLYPSSMFEDEECPPVTSYCVPGPNKSVTLGKRTILLVRTNSIALVSRQFCDMRLDCKGDPFLYKLSLLNEVVMAAFKSNQMDGDKLLNHFVVVTNKHVYNLKPKSCCVEFFVNSLSQQKLITAEQFAGLLRLNVSLLYEKAADYCLRRKYYVQAIKFNILAKTPQLERVANFASLGFYSEVIEYVSLLFKCYGSDIAAPDKVHFANIAVNCFGNLYLDKKGSPETTVVLKSFTTFLRENYHYDERLAIRLLVEHGLFEEAQLVADLRANYASLLQSLLFKIDDQEFPYVHYNELTTDRPSQSKLESLTSYITYIASPCTASAVLNQPHLLEKCLRFLTKLLPDLNLKLLIMLASCFDPRRAAVQILINRVLPRLQHQYLADDHPESELLSKRDFLNFYILVLLMIYRLKGKAVSFSEELLSVASASDFSRGKVSAVNSKTFSPTYQVAAGQFHCAAINNGILYTWGRAQFGRLGHTGLEMSLTSNETPSMVTFFEQNIAMAVRQVACGAAHTLVLTDCGLYSFGLSNFGQLGLGDKLQHTHCAALIESVVCLDLVKISCGQYHSLALTKSGDLYSWGWGVHGQLGHGLSDNVYKPMKIEAFNGTFISDVAGGYCHSVALDKDGKVYTFGNSIFGQLGLGTVCKHSLPQQVASISDQVVTISTHYFQSVIRTISNRLYSWGAHPQTIRLIAHSAKKARMRESLPKGPDSYTDHLSPNEINTESIDATVVKIGVGAMHCLFLTSSGLVYAYGRGIDGQLGHGTKKELKVPSLITSLFGSQVVDISAGFDFSVAIDANGQIWSWGQNNDRQLGTRSPSRAGGDGSSPSTDRKKITIKTSKRIITLPGSRHIESEPVRIYLPDADEGMEYQESLNYSVDLRAIRGSVAAAMNGLQQTPTQVPLSDFDLTNEETLNFDSGTLAKLIVKYKNDLDLIAIAKRCTSFNRYQIAAVVYELKEEYDRSLEYHLKSISLAGESETVHQQIKKTLISHLKRVLTSTVGKRTIAVIFEYWLQTAQAFDLQSILLEVYENDVRNFILGILVLHHVARNESQLKCHLSPLFFLDVVSITLSYLESADRTDAVICPPIMELISSANESALFPAEQMWQSIMKNISQSVQTLSRNEKSGV